MDPLLLQILYIIGFEVIILLLLAIIAMFDIVRVVKEIRRISEKTISTVEELTNMLQTVTHNLASLVNGAVDIMGAPGNWFGKGKKKKKRKKAEDTDGTTKQRSQKTQS